MRDQREEGEGRKKERDLEQACLHLYCQNISFKKMRINKVSAGKSL